MKRWIAVLAVMIAVMPCCARADEAAKQAKVHQLLMTMHMDRTVDLQMHSIVNQLVSAPAIAKMTPAQKKMTQDFQTRALKIISDRVGWKVVEPDYVKLYEKTYTEQEIDGMLAFYKSPVGQAMLAMAPQLQAGVTQIVRSHMGDYQQQMQHLENDYMKQIGPTLPATPPGKRTGH